MFFKLKKNSQHSVWKKNHRFLELIKTYMSLKGFKISQLFFSQVSITFASEDIWILGDAL